MSGPFRRQFLTKKERVQFYELVDRLGPVPPSEPDTSTLGWRTRLRLRFWRHLWAMTLFAPLGLTLMAVSLSTSWPLGLAGAPLLGVGLQAQIELFKRCRLRRRLRVLRDDDLTP